MVIFLVTRKRTQQHKKPGLVTCFVFCVPVFYAVAVLRKGDAFVSSLCEDYWKMFRV